MLVRWLTVVTLVTVVVGGCASRTFGPSYEHVITVRSDYDDAFYSLEAAAEATDQALSEAMEDCEHMPCQNDSVETFAQALETEHHANLGLNKATRQMLLAISELMDVSQDVCSSCSDYHNAMSSYMAAEDMYQQARSVENSIYLEWMECDTQDWCDSVTDRLTEEVVPRRADAARRLDRATQHMLDAEASLYEELNDGL